MSFKKLVYFEDPTDCTLAIEFGNFKLHVRLVWLWWCVWVARSRGAGGVNTKVVNFVGEGIDFGCEFEYDDFQRWGWGGWFNHN